MLRRTSALICLSLLIGGGCAKKAVPIATALSTDKESSRSYGVSQLAVSPMNVVAGSASAVSCLLLLRGAMLVVGAAGGVSRAVVAAGGLFSRDSPTRQSFPP